MILREETNMKIESVFDPAFQQYGQVLTGYDLNDLLTTLDAVTPLPDGVDYVPEQGELQVLPVRQEISDRAYGGMDVQLGWCNGHNTKLNCLEYHRDSELNVGTQDFILLVAKREEMAEGRLDTSKVRAFRCPAGVMVEVYGTTLHYAPCHVDPVKGFKVVIVLPRGTNLVKPAINGANPEDETLWARNKWLLAHAESSEASQGAPVRLDGVNIDIADLL